MQREFWQEKLFTNIHLEDQEANEMDLKGDGM
jgi:hypothetical protein